MVELPSSPPERFSYGDVLLLLLLALMLPIWGRARRLWLWLALALFGLAMGTTYVGHTETGSAPVMLFWSSWLRNAGIMVAAAGTLAVSLCGRARPSTKLRRASSSPAEIPGSAP